MKADTRSDRFELLVSIRPDRLRECYRSKNNLELSEIWDYFFPVRKILLFKRSGRSFGVARFLRQLITYNSSYAQVNSKWKNYVEASGNINHIFFSNQKPSPTSSFQQTCWHNNKDTTLFHCFLVKCCCRIKYYSYRLNWHKIKPNLP